MVDLSKSCLIVNLQISMWVGYKLDKKTTAKVTEDAGAKADAARVNKHLVTKESMARLTSAAGAIRLYFYAETLPWKDNGDRLLVRTRFEKFIEKFEELKGEFVDAKDDFLGVKYLQEKARGEFRMGDLYEESDYPDPSELESKFRVNMDIDMVSKAKDFRLQDDTAALQGRVNKAVGGLWQRVAEPLQHFAETISDDEKVFRDSCVNNLKEISAMIPDLNFIGDPNLDAIKEQIDAMIEHVEPKDLRKNPDLRAQIGKEASDILASMQGFISAFGGSK